MLTSLNPPAIDKQKDLLSSDTGHFSLIKALHLADLITELNGIPTLPTPRPFFPGVEALLTGRAHNQQASAASCPSSPP